MQLDPPGTESRWLHALDPGKHVFGHAAFFGGVLHFAQLVPAERGIVVEKDALIVCEYPEQRGKKSKVRTQDLIDLALSAGRFVGLRQAEFVRPSKWAGQVDYDTRLDRAWFAMSNAEHDVFYAAQKKTKPGLWHNVVDAICLGLWRVGRVP